MLDLFEMMPYVQKNLDAIQKVLDPDEGANFVTQYQKLVKQVTDQEEPQDRTKQELLTLVNRHPPALLLLHEAAPRLFPLPTTHSEGSPMEPTVNEKTAETAVDLPEPSLPTTSPASFTASLKLSQPIAAETRSIDVESPLGEATILAKRPTSASQKGTQQMDDKPTQTLWTPEVIMQAFKEIVTAILGLLLVGYTLVIANHSLTLTGSESQIVHAKDVLQLMLGLAGVVVGYYFGRVPADARAAQADQKAMAATVQAERVGAKGQEIANQLDDLFMANAVSTRSVESDTNLTAPELQRLRDELRELTALTQGRR